MKKLILITILLVGFVALMAWLTDTDAATNAFSADFERTNSEYMRVADNASLSILADITIMARVNAESFAAANVSMIAAKQIGAGASRSYGFMINDASLCSPTDSQCLAFWFTPDGGGASEERLDSPQRFTEGLWYHVAVTWTAATSVARFYVNGAFIGSQTGVGTAIFDGTQDFRIAANRTDNFNGAWDGKQDDVRVYPRVLSQEEIQFAYRNGECTGDEPNIVGCWKLNDLSFASSTDESPSLNTLSNINTVPASDDVGLGARFIRVIR